MNSSVHNILYAVPKYNKNYFTFKNYTGNLQEKRFSFSFI